MIVLNNCVWRFNLVFFKWKIKVVVNCIFFGINVFIMEIFIIVVEWDNFLVFLFKIEIVLMFIL